MTTNALQKQENRGELARAEPAQAVFFTPRVDILETEDELTLFADLPGVAADNVDVRYENGELSLHGRCPPRRRGERPVAEEYEVGDFYRAFTIGEAIDAEHIAAEMRDGVLTVHLPKTEAVKPRRITVKNADGK